MLRFLSHCGLLAVLALAGCRVRYAPVTTARPPLPATYAGSTDTTHLTDFTLPALLKDSMLVALVDTALQNSPDLHMALQRIRQAEGHYISSRGPLLPQVSTQGSAGVDRYGRYTMNGVGNEDTNLSPNVRGKRRIPNPVPDYFIGLRASWEIDLWGKLGQRRQAALLRWQASGQARQLARTVLTAEVARHYYTLLGFDAEMAILRENIDLQQKALDLVEVQKVAGRVTELAVQQFRAQLYGTQALRGQVTQQRLETENRLNTLLGRYPQPVPRGDSLEFIRLPGRILAGVPVQLLSRRPDLRQAENELAAAGLDAAAARADLLPTLTLTPYAGFNAFRPELLFNPASMAAGLLGGLAAPVFNRYGLQGQVVVAEARRQEAWYAYRKTLLTGVAEVYTSLQAIDNYRQVADLRRRETAELRRAALTARELFATGYATYLEVITAQRSVLEAELNLIHTKRDRLVAFIDLYRALGGTQ